MYIQKMGPVLVRLAKELAEKQEAGADDADRRERSAEGERPAMQWFFGAKTRKDDKKPE